MSFFSHLRFMIPATIVVVAGIIIYLSLLLITPVIEKQNEETLKLEAYHSIGQLSSSLEYLLWKKDFEGAQREVERYASPLHVENLVVFDEAGQVVFSANEEMLGMSLHELKAFHLDTQLITGVKETDKVRHYYNRDEHSLYTLSGLSMPGQKEGQLGSIGSISTGVILLELSAKGALEAASKEIRFIISSLTGAMVILVLILIFILNKVVTSRIVRLVQATHLFSENKHQAEHLWTGNDELGELGRAFNSMALKIEASHAQQAANAALLDELLENSPSTIVIRDTEGRYLRANAAYLKVLGDVSLEDIIGRYPIDFLPDDVAAFASEGDQRVLETRQLYRSERSFNINNKMRTFFYERFPLFDDMGEIYGVCTIAADMTRRSEQEKELRLARYIFETTNDGIIITDENNLIVDVNPSFERVTGYSREEVVGKAPNILNSHNQTPTFYEEMWKKIETVGVWSGEITNRKKSGEIFPEWLTVKSILDEHGVITGFFGVFSDISEQKKTENSLRNLAYYDSLTSLANRTLCKERLSHDMQLSDRHKELLALVFIDLDFFKHVNDTLGHEYGDQLLIEVAKRIKEEVRRSDTVVRWGGDEFILILPGVFEGNMALVIASNVLEALKKPFNLKNTDVYIGASIGIAVYPNDAEDAETLIQHADAAMYSAKSKGRDQICFFDPELNRKNIEHIQIKAGLRTALEYDEFEMYYQPKVSIGTGEIVGLEALLRWNSHDRGQISPEEFIPVAESSGLIVPIGGWVFSSVCKQVDSWIKDGLLKPGQRVSVNFSPRQFAHPNFISDVMAQQSAYEGIENYLSIEITETAVIENIDKSLPLLHKLQALGLQIELDDFGSGYSSLNYLRQLPVDVLKVDKSFIAEIANSDAERAIMGAIIHMAEMLKIQVVAEGVETKEQLSILEGLKCQLVQGYYFSKPVPAQITSLLLKRGFQNAEE